MFRRISENPALEVFGTIRNEGARRHFNSNNQNNIISGVNIESQDDIIRAFAATKPDVVINCVGLVKQLADANDPLQAVPLNTLLPHRLARICQAIGARLVHISTDCVFSGKRGNYLESDFPDAEDLYGRSKFLGEVDYPNAITLRTSIIGHELGGTRSLVNWFLSQNGEVEGFTKAIFSGLPTVELSNVVHDHVLPKPELHGLFHVSADAISKHDLLHLVAKTYGKSIQIKPSDRLVIDRSLNSDKFRKATGYRPATWPTLVQRMLQFS